MSCVVSFDSFVAAEEHQESGDSAAVNVDSGARGRFQILPANWSRWAAEAGLGSDAPWTAENQLLVARSKMARYLKAFNGDYRAVAIAWYAGPGAVRWPAWRLNRRQGHYPRFYPSVNAYADSVMARACA